MCTDRWRQETKLWMLHEGIPRFTKANNSMKTVSMVKIPKSKLIFASICMQKSRLHPWVTEKPPSPPNSLAFVLVVNKHKYEDFNTCLGYLLLQIKFIILIIFLSSQLMQRNKAVSLSWQDICLYFGRPSFAVVSAPLLRRHVVPVRSLALRRQLLPSLSDVSCTLLVAATLLDWAALPKLGNLRVFGQW
jgi:hypothetical protein